MNWNTEAILANLNKNDKEEILLGGLSGLERETLRVNSLGELSQKPHPLKLSNPLNDPNITLDFSESQLELITSPHKNLDTLFDELHQIHKRMGENLDEELNWPFSMPAILPEHDQIPIAKFDNSEEGIRKYIYRKGLATRYGRFMQTLCGIHYNYNFNPDLIKFLAANYFPDSNLAEAWNEIYLGVVRTFINWRWLLVYLFGASPYCHSSYKCKALKKRTEAVSLRLSRCGYSNPAKIEVSYNSFNQHLLDIQKAVDTVYTPYSELGVFKDGEQIQLNDHLLQLPAEYYFSIRMKPKEVSGNPLQDLSANGVRYLEVRILDVNPFSPYGIEKKQLQFLQIFLIACLFTQTSKIEKNELETATLHQEEIALSGRNLNLEELQSAKLIFAQMKKIATIMDKYENNNYLQLLENYEEELENPINLPWKKITSQSTAEDFIAFGLELAGKYKKLYLQK